MRNQKWSKMSASPLPNVWPHPAPIQGVTHRSKDEFSCQHSLQRYTLRNRRLKSSTCASIFFRLSRVMLQGRVLKQGSPDCPLPSQFVQLFLGNPKVFLGQSGDIAFRACPSMMCLEHFTGELSRSHPNEMPEPPHLATVDSKDE